MSIGFGLMEVISGRYKNMTEALLEQREVAIKRRMLQQV